MINERLQKRKAELEVYLEKLEDEAVRLAEMCQFARVDLAEVETVEDAEVWEKKYRHMEDKFEHIRLF